MSEPDVLDLMECPFCGGEGKFCYSCGKGYIVVCLDCGCGTKYHKCGWKAINDWQRRVNKNEGVHA